jgi:P-type E1-E2 ATPase
MGGADCICSDKTGTLTKNEMDVVKIWCDMKKVSSFLILLMTNGSIR